MNNVYAKIIDNIVTNLIICDNEFAIKNQLVAADNEVCIGWSYVNGQFIAPPQPQPTPEEIQKSNKQKSESLLNSTDWVELPSVSDTASTPYLTNANEFLAYRSALRSIAVNPPSEPVVFPSKPDEVWE